MSHRDTCPDPMTARSEGRRAFQNGRGRWRNPYRSDGDQPCEEAEREFNAGHRAAEREQEEQAQREEWHRQEQERQEVEE